MCEEKFGGWYPPVQKFSDQHLNKKSTQEEEREESLKKTINFETLQKRMDFNLFK